MSSYLGCRKPHLGCRTTSVGVFWGVQKNLIWGAVWGAQTPRLGWTITMIIDSTDFYYTNSININILPAVYY